MSTWPRRCSVSSTWMRAAVAERVGVMSVLDRPEPGEPGPGQVLVRPEAVGLCGSDYHLFAGEMSDAAGGSQFPRVLGHEVGATIAAVGPDCRAGLATGGRVAMLPISGLPALLPVQRRPPQRLRQLPAHRHPRRWRAAGAADPPRGPGLSH